LCGGWLNPGPTTPSLGALKATAFIPLLRARNSARIVYGLSRLTIITQRYHSYRALFLARKSGMKAVAFSAPSEGVVGPGFRHPPREVLARLLAVLDLFVLQTEPRSERQEQPAGNP
jgi:vancomycin permeability regulator SanA